MRTTLLLCLLTCISLQGLAQSHGITYQAIILSRADHITEIPGMDVPGGSYLPDQALEMRFTILDASGNIEYQETHSTATDRYGLVSVIIGDGSMTSASPDVFEEIDWNGSPKDLRVEVNIPAPQGQGQYMEFSVQKLVFAPYVYHRNITATGTLYIAGASTLDSSLVVSGTTDLNNGLDVNFGKPTNLSGTLNVGGAAVLNSSLDVYGATSLHYTLDVDGATNLNSTLDVDGGTTLNSTLDVDGSTTLNHSLDVDGATTLNNTLDVDGAATLNSTLDVDGATVVHNTLDVEGRTTINASISGAADNTNSYPLLVQGGQHGVAVQVTATDMDGSTNFITFFDGNGDARGRIEGENGWERHINLAYAYEAIKLVTELGIAISETAAAVTSSTACLGAGACVTTPIPSWNVVAWIKVAVASANIIAFEAHTLSNIGVTYASGSADYAEWLERADPGESMIYGDIVSVRGGKITKNTRQGAERYMVISLKPAVLGNMPSPDREQFYEKVGFMGQVPVKVRGPVNVGDYVLPSGFSDGTGRAVAPDAMTLDDYAHIVGVAWSATQNPFLDYINVAIGLNNNDLVGQLARQRSEMDDLRAELNAVQDALKQIIPQFSVQRKASAVPLTITPSETGITAEELHPEVDRKVVEEAVDELLAMVTRSGIDVDSHAVFGPIKRDPVERAKFIDHLIEEAPKFRQHAIEIDRRHGYR
ncbi:MAG: hypothetical protein JNM31_09750 [Flavobacteriales bacterium]|nr:hypothetical protein [Flavobacteriales bacterium]